MHRLIVTTVTEQFYWHNTGGMNACACLCKIELGSKADRFACRLLLVSAVFENMPDSNKIVNFDEMNVVYKYIYMNIYIYIFKRQLAMCFGMSTINLRAISSRNLTAGWLSVDWILSASHGRKYTEGTRTSSWLHKSSPSWSHIKRMWSSWHSLAQRRVSFIAPCIDIIGIDTWVNKAIDIIGIDERVNKFINKCE